MEQLQSISASERLKQLLGPQPVVIGFEGGPCGGKTTLANSVVDSGYHANRNVVILEEVATKHITALEQQGVNFFDLLQHNRPAFLEVEVGIVLDIVKAIEEAKVRYANTDTIIIADRTTVKPYMTPEEYQWVLARAGLTYDPHLQLIDTMVYLPSVAREDEALYETLKATNTARYEPADIAQAICDANFRAVNDHPELHVFWGGSFEEKIAEATEVITHPEREIEPKFVPINTAAFEAFLAGTITSGEYIGRTVINQSYHNIDGIEARLRRAKTSTGQVVHFCSFKEALSSTEKHERRRTISQFDYDLLLDTPVLGSIEKQRHSFFVTEPTTGKRLIWTADEYQTETGRLWNIEVEVPSADMLDRLHFPVALQAVDYSARDLAIARAA